MLLFFYYTTLHFTAALPAIQQLGLWVGSNNIYISSASMSTLSTGQFYVPTEGFQFLVTSAIPNLSTQIKFSLILSKIWMLDFVILF